MSREIRLNAFDMNCVGHQSPGLWRHPRDQSWKYKDLDYWVHLAKTLERGKFDGLFIADVLGVYDVLNGNVDAALRHSTQVPVNDPLQLMPTMSYVTEHLGFGLTASLSFEHPYTFARRISTLDHLTKGRVGWNIVTSYLNSGAQNIGQAARPNMTTAMISPKNISRSATSSGKAAGKTAPWSATAKAASSPIRRKVHPIHHAGKHFTVPGIHSE
jgi:alkanesulfonate monooxygenase SsuD/methylene tetrahydromethanopterin reductase-like flavin-dependent oxidoreductase (luciferase family)